MNSYRSKSGKPFGVTGYELGAGYIIIRFQNGALYKYTIHSCGAAHVRNMSRLAVGQKGLSTYIAQYHPRYEAKL